MAAKRVRKPFSMDIRRTTTVFVSSHVPQECPQHVVPSSCYPIRPVSHEQFLKKPKIVIVRLVTGTLLHRLLSCVGDVVKEDINVVSALPLVGFRQKDIDISFWVKMNLATVPPSLLRTFRVVRNTLQWIQESMFT